MLAVSTRSVSLAYGVAHEKERITVAPDKLSGGSKYLLRVIGETPGSYPREAVLTLWVSQVPDRGSCETSVTQGRAMTGQLSLLIRHSAVFMKYSSMSSNFIKYIFG